MSRINDYEDRAAAKLQRAYEEECPKFMVEPGRWIRELVSGFFYRLSGFCKYWLPVMAISCLVGFAVSFRMPEAGVYIVIGLAALLTIAALVQIRPRDRGAWQAFVVFFTVIIPWLCLGSFLGRLL